MTEEDAGPCKPTTTTESCSSDSGTTSKVPETAPGSGSGAGCDSLSSQKVFKKTSANSKLTMYLSSRDLVVSAGRIDKLQGVILIDPDFVEDRKVYGQITLTFRYGREDEEVMGLKFCNEAIMCLAQLYPVHPNYTLEGITPLQEALIKRLGPNAYPFNMEITALAPPSVQLVPAKEYRGAPIGTSYDVRAYIGERADDNKQRRVTSVRMGIRVVQRAVAPPSPHTLNTAAGQQQQNAKEQQQRKHHKISLFGCKSAPIHASKMFETIPITTPTSATSATTTTTTTMMPNQGKSLSAVEVRVEASPQNENAITPTATTPAPVQTPREKSPSKVSFSEQVNGADGERMPVRIVSQDNERDCNQMIHQDARECEFDASRRASLAAYLSQIPAPHAVVEKPFLLSDGRIELAGRLNKAIYHHGEEVHVHVEITNRSNKTIKRIKVFIVQHVDVCMFSNGKFKNIVALINTKEDCHANATSANASAAKKVIRDYTLIPIKSATKNWIALEDSYTRPATSLASSVSAYSNNPDERNVFAIYVSYYVKIKLVLSVMGGEVALKLPFTLMHTCDEFSDSTFGTLTRVVDAPIQHRTDDTVT